MTSELNHLQNFSSSKLYMWRTIIAIAHADGNVCEDERGYLEGVLLRMKDSGLSNEQYALLIEDLDTAQDAIDMLKEVDDPRYRGQILHFAQMIAAKDGMICEAEQALLDRLHAAISNDMDIDAVCTEERVRLLNSLNDSETTSHGKFVAMMEKFISSTGLKD